MDQLKAINLLCSDEETVEDLLGIVKAIKVQIPKFVDAFHDIFDELSKSKFPTMFAKVNKALVDANIEAGFTREEAIALAIDTKTTLYKQLNRNK